VLTVNAMVAADELLIPVETQYFALEALQTLLEVVESVRETLQPGLRIAGIVPTKHESRVRVCQVTLELLRERYPELLTRTVVRKYVAYPEAQMRGLPIYSVAPGSDAAAAYQQLALELDGDPQGPTAAAEVVLRPPTPGTGRGRAVDAPATATPAGGRPPQAAPAPVPLAGSAGR
jgi:chromosome partitioning protein